MIAIALVGVVIQALTVGALLLSIRTFGAFSASANRNNQALYYEVINMLEEVRRLREVNETLNTQRRA